MCEAAVAKAGSFSSERIVPMYETLYQEAVQ
jgi:hypothetical protein